MELTQGYSRRQDMGRGEAVHPAAQGLAGWVVGALQGRVRIKWKSSAAARSGHHMELLETLSLGGKRQVMLIACEGERYLVGCGADAVATIEKLTAAVAESRTAVKIAPQRAAAAATPVAIRAEVPAVHLSIVEEEEAPSLGSSAAGYGAIAAGPQFKFLPQAQIHSQPQAVQQPWL